MNDAETRALATRTVEPEWPAKGLTKGQRIKVEVSVNEKGELAGTGLSGVPPAAFGPILKALHQWQFKPLMKDGKPQYFHGTVEFPVS